MTKWKDTPSSLPFASHIGVMIFLVIDASEWSRNVAGHGGKTLAALVVSAHSEKATA